MNTHILATRAICAIYAQRAIKPLLYVVSGCIFGYIAFITFLTVQFSGWWAVFFIPVIPFILFVVVAAYIAFAAMRIIAPSMTPAQQELANTYIDTFTEITGHIQTPKFVIVFKIVSDILRRRWQNGFVYRTTEQSVRLKTDFQKLAKSFE